MSRVYEADQPLQVHYFNTVLDNGQSCAVNVIREDYITCGTKQRGYSYFDKLKREGVNKIASPVFYKGYGQLALTFMANKYGIDAYLFINGNIKQKNNPLYDYIISLGGKFIYVRKKFIRVIKGSMDKRGNTVSLYSLTYKIDNRTYELNVESGRADITILDLIDCSRKFVEGINNGRAIDLGINDEEYIDILSTNIRSNSINIYPRRLWVTVGSGTILKALVKVWPNTHFLCLRVGTAKADNVIDKLNNPGGHTKYIYDSSLAQDASEYYRPVYNSMNNYDAKIWEFFIKYGEDGDYIWNTAGNPNKSSIIFHNNHYRGSRGYNRGKR